MKHTVISELRERRGCAWAAHVKPIAYFLSRRMAAGQESRVKSMFRGSLQRQERDFGRAIPAHRNPHCSQADIRVKLKPTHFVSPHEVLLGQRGEIKRRQERHSDLASVRMPGKLQVDWKSRSFIGEVRFMSKENNCFVRGNAMQSLRQVGGLAEHIVDASQPN